MRRRRGGPSARRARDPGRPGAQQGRHSRGPRRHAAAGGRLGARGFLDDHAFTIQGLLDLFEAHPDSRWLEGAIELQQNPVPNVSVVDCPDEAAWINLVAQLNHPTEEGREQNAIVIHSPDDLIRLRRAVLLDKVIQLNGGRSRTNLNNFSLGKVLLIPEPDPEKVHLLDPRTAKLFYHTEHYYRAFIDRLTTALLRAETQLKEGN